MGMAKEASLVIRMITMADYEAAHFVMYLVMVHQEIPLMKLLEGHAPENSEKPKIKNVKRRKFKTDFPSSTARSS